MRHSSWHECCVLCVWRRKKVREGEAGAFRGVMSLCGLVAIYGRFSFRAPLTSTDIVLLPGRSLRR